MSLWTMRDEAAGKPKYLNSDEKALVHGVDASEESVVSNKAKGVQHPGWVRTLTYTDSSGNTRNKSETLVAAGSMSVDLGAQGVQDDAVIADA